MSGRRFFKRWLPWAATAIVVALLFIWDDRLKRTDAPGFLPPNAAWSVHALDAGAFWSSFTSLPAYQRFEDAGLRPIRGFERFVYRRTAVRPNGLRWNVWFGERLLAGGLEDTWGLCTHPGLLLRLGTFLHGIGAETSGDGIRRYGEFHYAWRDGFFILSPSDSYVRACLNADRPEHIARLNSNLEAALQWGDRSQQALHVRAESGLPVSGRIEMAVSHRARPLSISNGLAEEAVLFAAGSRWSDLAEIYATAAPFLQRVPNYESIVTWIEKQWRQWQLTTPARLWDDGVDASSFALLNIDWRAFPPVPELAVAFTDTLPGRNVHPLQEVVSGAVHVPFVWSDSPGTYTPLLSDSFGVALGKYENTWYAATQPETMARVIQADGSLEELNADAVVEIDWQGVSELLRSTVEPLLAYGLISGIDRQELEYLVLPYVTAPEGLGTLRLQGAMVRGEFAFEGFLAQGAALDEE